MNKMEREKLAGAICEGHCKYVLQNHPFFNNGAASVNGTLKLLEKHIK
jgi:hypothetical protein